MVLYKMKVGIDARVLGRRGVGRYLSSLVSALAKTAPEDQFHLFLGSRSNRASIKEIKNISFEILPNKHPALLEQRIIPWLARRRACDLLHYPDNTGAMAPGLPTVLTMHDTMWRRPLRQAVARPTVKMYLQDAYRKWVCPRAAAAAKALITISEYSRVDVLENLKLDPFRVTVISEALHPFFKQKMSAVKAEKVRTGLSLKLPYVLVSGAADKRKNIDRLIRAFATASGKNKILAKAKLVITSMQPGESAATTYVTSAHRAGVAARIDLLGYVSDEQMKALYQGALCFAFPSLWEGFGLPILEAYSMACPVLVSNGSALRQTAGKGALLVDPLDDAAMAQGLLRVVQPAVAKRLRTAGKKELSRFSWEKAAKKTLQVYRKALA